MLRKRHPGTAAVLSSATAIRSVLLCIKVQPLPRASFLKPSTTIIVSYDVLTPISIIMDTYEYRTARVNKTVVNKIGSVHVT